MSNVFVLDANNLALPRGFSGIFDAASYEKFASEPEYNPTQKPVVPVFQMVNRLIPQEQMKKGDLAIELMIVLRSVNGEDVRVAVPSMPQPMRIYFGGLVETEPGQGAIEVQLALHAAKMLKQQTTLELSEISLHHYIRNAHFVYTPNEEGKASSMGVCFVANFTAPMQLQQTKEGSPPEPISWIPTQELRSMPLPSLCPWSNRLLLGCIA